MEKDLKPETLGNGHVNRWFSLFDEAFVLWSFNHRNMNTRSSLLMVPNPFP